jgi:hypothetical protein
VAVDPSRLRRGELIVGASVVVLTISTFALDWFGVSGGGGTSVNGWDGLTNVRWLMLLAIVCAILLVVAQATRRAPAVPVALSVAVTVVAIPTALALIYRVLINQPDGSGGVKVGAFVGLASALALAYGGYESMRQEGIAPRDAPAEIETIRLSDQN